MAQSLRLIAVPAVPAQLAAVVESDDHPSIEKRKD
jgi:hypothetical protein